MKSEYTHVCNSRCGNGTHQSVLLVHRMDTPQDRFLAKIQEDLVREGWGYVRILRETLEYTAEPDRTWKSGVYKGKTLGEYPPTHGFLVEWEDQV